MKLLVWSGTPSGTVWSGTLSGTVWSSPDSAEGFSLAVLSHSTHTKWVFHRPRILFWQHSRGCLRGHGSHLETSQRQFLNGTEAARTRQTRPVKVSSQLATFTSTSHQ